MEALHSNMKKQARKSIVVTADVCMEEDVKNLVAKSVESLRDLTVSFPCSHFTMYFNNQKEMVANAGIIPTKRTMDKMPGEWD